jgi:hypothetical protein
MEQDPRDQDDNAADDGPMSVPDEDLPEDLRPGDDNPLASGDPEDVSSPGDDDAAGGTASSNEASSGTG